MTEVSGGTIVPRGTGDARGTRTNGVPPGIRGRGQGTATVTGEDQTIATIETATRGAVVTPDESVMTTPPGEGGGTPSTAPRPPVRTGLDRGGVLAGTEGDTGRIGTTVPMSAMTEETISTAGEDESTATGSLVTAPRDEGTTMARGTGTRTTMTGGDRGLAGEARPRTTTGGGRSQWRGHASSCSPARSLWRSPARIRRDAPAPYLEMLAQWTQRLGRRRLRRS